MGRIICKYHEDQNSSKQFVPQGFGKIEEQNPQTDNKIPTEPGEWVNKDNILEGFLSQISLYGGDVTT